MIICHWTATTVIELQLLYITNDILLLTGAVEISINTEFNLWKEDKTEQIKKKKRGKNLKYFGFCVSSIY